MDQEKGVNGAAAAADGGGTGIDVTEKKTLSDQGKAGSLEKCLEENKGDDTKCKAKVEAFKSSSSSSPQRKPLTPLKLRSGSFSDV
ncbi:hypothetical protein CCACVL1_14127 [Corchorus capsularis]|uniref:Uncharacterized protein n=1 Tax=Corchorus capsularis TaxID=210143 RepID=A0A1R3I893_COCAP|nr:hypothetical protein CCACVL1_14127 [Corchorus capsularis]